VISLMNETACCHETKQQEFGKRLTYRCRSPANWLNAPKLEEIVLNSTCFSSKGVEGSEAELCRR
jgi:hypothetical protein